MRRRLLPSRSLVAGLLLLGIPAVATAQTMPGARPGPAFAFVLDAGVEYGGEHIATTYFDNGSEQKMLAGQGGTVALGVELRPNLGSPLSLRATVGYKFVLTAADNANIRLTRIPVEVVASYDVMRDFRVGVGYVRHLAVKYSGDGFAEDMELKDANGATVELGWRWLALTYTAMRYEDEFGDRFDASSVGAAVIVPIFRP